MVRQFKDRSFKARFEKLGDMAEGVFSSWASSKGLIVVDYGLRRPPFEYFKNLPAFIRHTPDFLVEQTDRVFTFKDARNRVARHFFVETKGCGQDQIVKIKHKEFEALEAWQATSERPVVLFIYDSYNQRVSIDLSVDAINGMRDELPVNYYEDGGPPKAYWEISTGKLSNWELAAEDRMA